MMPKIKIYNYTRYSELKKDWIKILDVFKDSFFEVLGRKGQHFFLFSKGLYLKILINLETDCKRLRKKKHYR